jgi:hypothetical protein
VGRRTQGPTYQKVQLPRACKRERRALKKISLPRLPISVRLFWTWDPSEVRPPRQPHDWDAKLAPEARPVTTRSPAVQRIVVRDAV